MIASGKIYCLDDLPVDEHGRRLTGNALDDWMSKEHEIKPTGERQSDMVGNALGSVGTSEDSEFRRAKILYLRTIGDHTPIEHYPDYCSEAIYGENRTTSLNREQMIREGKALLRKYGFSTMVVD